MKTTDSEKTRTWIRLIIITGVSALGLGQTSAGDGKSGVRPVVDFVDAQGTFCIPDGGGGCFLFVPPIENFFGWSDSGDDPGVADDTRISMDYAGLADRWIKAESGGAKEFHTSFSGNVVERAVGDGLTEVKVTLITRNALTWVVEGGDFNNPLIFGARAPDVIGGAKPALGDCVFKVTFVHRAEPGAPLPDLVELFVTPEEGEEVQSMSFHGSAFGGTDEGTRARASVQQIAPTLERFTVGNVTVKPVGRK